MTHAKELARHGSIIVTTQTIGVIASLGFTAYFLRVMSKEQIAVTAMMVVIEGVVSLFKDWGLATNAIKYVPGLIAGGKKTRANELIKMTWLIPLFSSVFIGLLMLAFRGQLGILLLKTSDYNQILIWAIGYGVVSSLLNQVFLLMQSLQKFESMSWLNLAVLISQRLLSFLGWVRLGLAGYLIGFVAATLFGLLYGMYWLRPYMKARLKMRLLKKTIKDSFPFYLSGFVRYFYYQADQLVVAIVMSPVSFATYFVLRGIVRQLIVLWDNFFVPLSPKLSQLRHRSSLELASDLNILQTLATWVLLAFSFCLFAGAKAGLTIYTGGAYTNSFQVMQIMSLMLVPYGLTTIIGSMVFIFNKPREKLLLELSMSVSSIVLMFGLTKIAGVAGAAWSQVFTYLIAVGVGYWLVRKNIKTKFPFAFALTYLALTTAVTVITLTFLTPLKSELVTLATVSAIGLMLFIAGFFMLNSQIRYWLKSYVIKR